MTTIEISGGKLILSVKGFDVIFALKHTLEIPLSHIVSAEPGIPQDAHERLQQSVRLPGTHLPGLITAGSYLEHGRWMFWDVHKGEQAITIHTRHEKYEQVIVDVEEPAATAARIRAAVGEGAG